MEIRLTEPARAKADGTAPQLRLADFIRQEMEAVIAEWVAFASSHVPAGANMTQLALRDHIVEILNFIADDLESPQTAHEQVSKSKGDGPAEGRIQDSAAEIHASLRLNDGFNIDQMVSEYRALRASVVKQWTARKQPGAETDINDLTRFNEAIDQAIAESVAEYTNLIDRSRNLFLGILGHDLRNPIGAASMAGAMLQRLAPPDTKQMVLASQIVDATQRGIQILNDLLDITRSAFGTDIPIVRAPMDMGHLGVQLVEEMRSLAKGRTIEINVVGETEGEWDKARLGQVFSNLIGNAIEYSFPGGIISVTVAGNPDGVILSVHNGGSPIPAEKLVTIFEALTRAQPLQVDQQVSSHLGLGLYITKKIVMAHNGDIDVDSTDQEGTTFTVRLPRK
jgi:signal transduction histidine kinase